ncbi:MAG: hypothetical protein AAB432_02550 [Patescibacteria group bacterium]
MKYQAMFLSFCFVFLLPIKTKAQFLDAIPQKTTITGHYSFDIDYHNVFKFIGAKILGIEPKELILTETITTLNDSETEFSMELATDEKNCWFYISSDTTTPSFIHLPREPKKEFQANTFQFFKKMRAFIHNDSTKYVGGFLTIDTTEIFASFYEHGPVVVSDSDKIKINTNKKRYIGVHSEEATDDHKAYINGEIITGRKGECVIYPYVAAYLAEQNISVKIYLKSVTIEYSN